MLSTILSSIGIYSSIGAIVGVSSYLYYEYPETSIYSQFPGKLAFPIIFGISWPFLLYILYTRPELMTRDVRLWPQELRQIIVPMND